MSTYLGVKENRVAGLIERSGFLDSDIDYYLLRGAMVLIFLSFGCQKWFSYEADRLAWRHRFDCDLYRHRDDHSVHAGGWDPSAGGHPAMTGNVPFLMKDAVLIAVSIYLFKQDLTQIMRGTSRRTWS